MAQTQLPHWRSTLEGGNPLDQPESSGSADHESNRRPRAPHERLRNRHAFEQHLYCQDRADEQELAEFDPCIEREQRERNVACRESNLREGSRKSETMQEVERERNDPRPALGDACLSSTRSQDLAGEQDNR